jgi:hypothetical protein
MSRTNHRAQDLIDAASRYEALPSPERVAAVRSKVLRRAVVGGIAVGATSTSLLAKATALGATTLGQVAIFASVGALAGGVVLGATARNVTVPKDTMATAAAAPVKPEIAAAPTSTAIITGKVIPTPAAQPIRIETREASPLPSPVVRPDEKGTPATSGIGMSNETKAPNDIERYTAPAAPAKSEDALVEQLELLKRMRSDLANRQSQDVLSLYRDNQELFRGGSLEPEARFAVVAALCQLGRIDEANLEARRFQAAFPGSLLARRLASGCAGQAAP